MKRKLTLLVGVIALLGITLTPAQSAWATLYGANEVQNGDFETGNLNYWTASGTFAVYQEPGNYFAGTYGTNGPASGSIYQVIDETAYSGWNPLGTAKLWSFQGGYDNTSLDSVRFALYYYPSNPATAPAFNPTNPTGWTNFLDHTIIGDATGTYQTQGTIDNFQPRWVAVLIQTDAVNQAFALVDNIDFEGQCVPLPPTAWLLGSSLLGLAGWRRFRKS